MDNSMGYKYKVTTHGRAVMAACMALGQPLNIRRVVFGSGKVAEDVNLADVHELLEYVSEGAVAERRHEDERFYLTIQYCNQVHPEVKMFLLSEFIVLVLDPETGEETDFIYGSLGDYRQPVPAYNPAWPPSTFNFPLTVILSDEINVQVSAPAGLVTHDELLSLLNGIGTNSLNLTIPTSGWVPDSDTGGACALHLDLAHLQITEEMVPMLNFHPLSLPEACNCGICPSVRTLDGFVRIYVERVPEQELSATLILLDTSYMTSGAISGSAIVYLDDFEIPADGWETDSDTGGTYTLHRDIPCEDITEKQTPMLSVKPESMSAAGRCGLGPMSRTLSGALRVYAERVPENPLSASLSLVGTAPYSNGGGVGSTGGTGSITLLPATDSTLGGVRVRPGSGLTVDSSGNLSLDIAAGEETAELFGGSKD